MVSAAAPEPIALGSVLPSIRAAIDVVRTGVARRVVIYLPQGRSLLPAVRAMARAAGVEVTPRWSSDPSSCVIEIHASADG
jgi:hypothetical protein